MAGDSAAPAWSPVAAAEILTCPGGQRSEASPSPAYGVRCERVGPAARHRGFRDDVDELPVKIGWVAPADLGSAPEVMADTLALTSSPKANIGREGKMHNQHAGLTGVLSEQRMTEHQQQAARERLVRSARSPRRRRQQATRRWWQLVLRPTSA